MNQDILLEAINSVGDMTSNEEYISDRNLQIFVKEINDLKTKIQSLEILQVIELPREIPVKSETDTKKERIHDDWLCFCSESNVENIIHYLSSFF